MLEYKGPYFWRETALDGDWVLVHTWVDWPGATCYTTQVDMI